MTNTSFDVIGDIHGHADALRRLLHKMDYREHDGVFRHASRRVVFVGDFIDRGPQQRDVLDIAMRMCAVATSQARAQASALAVMGNHEFNARCWAEPDADGGFRRSRAKSA